MALRRPGCEEEAEEDDDDDGDDEEDVVGRIYGLDEDGLSEGMGGGGRNGGGGGEPSERLRACFVKHSARFL